MKGMNRLVVTGVAGALLAAGTDPAWALSQWGRKYQMSCNTCHTVMPRLNATGERFMRNGYQMPGSRDGDTQGKSRVNDNLVLNELGNMLGVRLNFTPIEVKTNVRKENGKTDQRQVDVGKPSWVQIFPGGTIFKDVSTFAEIEFTGDGKLAISWLKVGFHNLLDTSLLNVRAGQLAPTEWHVASGRLRMLPPQESWRNVKSANGKGEDSVDVGGGKPAAAVYGYTGPFLYEVGVQNGASLTDPNGDKNYWTTLRLETTGGPTDGSAVTVFGMTGVDTKDAATALKFDKFRRVSPGVNLRYQGLDFVGAYIYGEDDNWKLVESTKTATLVVHRSALAQIGYLTGKWYGVLRYDIVDTLSDTSINFNKVTPSLWYLAKENLKIGAIVRVDLDRPDTQKQNEYTLMMRAMY